MHLIVIILALFAERALGQFRHWRDTDGFERYVAWIERRKSGARWLAHPSGVLVIAPPIIVVALIQWAIGYYLWLGVGWLFGVVVLLLSLGPRDLWEDVYALAHARGQADHDQSEALAFELCQRAIGYSREAMSNETVLGAVFVEGHERVLGILLWYFVAGPAGALFYRLVRELPALAARGAGSPTLERNAEYVHGAAAWVPVRIAALLYALAGQTTHALAMAWRTRTVLHLGATASWQLLAATGRGAIGLAKQPDAARFGRGFNDTLLEALGLIWRALLLLLALMGLLTIFGLLR